MAEKPSLSNNRIVTLEDSYKKKTRRKSKGTKKRGEEKPILLRERERKRERERESERKSY